MPNKLIHAILHTVISRKRPFLSSKWVKCSFQIMNYFGNSQNTEKNSKLETFWRFSGLFWLFGICQRFFYEKNYVLCFLLYYFLHFKVNFESLSLRNLIQKLNPIAEFFSGIFHWSQNFFRMVDMQYCHKTNLFQVNLFYNFLISCELFFLPYSWIIYYIHSFKGTVSPD